MARPKKKPSAVMSTDLRIPVTPEQKRIVKKAIAILGVDMTAWARPLLVNAANDVLARGGESKKSPSGGLPPAGRSD